MNILLVVDYFPPLSAGGRAYRAAKLTKYLTRAGHRVAVACSDDAVDPDASLLAGADIDRLTILRCRKPRSGLARLFARALRQFAVADGQYLLAYRLLDAVLKRQIGFIPDAVITSSAPYEVHAVGSILKNRFGLRWIADFRDPYTLDVKYTKHIPTARLLDKAFERWIYKHADGVIFNTFLNREQALHEFSLAASRRYHVCQNGYDPEDLAVAQAANPRIHDGLVRIAYIGGIRGYDEERTFISALLAARTALFELGVRFHLIGNGAELLCAQAAASDGLIDVRGFVGQAALTEQWSRADAFFLVLPPASGNWVPQKLYSYLGTGKPILAIVPDGEARDYLQESGNAVIADPGDRSDIIGLIRRLRDNVRVGAMSDPKIRMKFAQPRLFHDLETWLESICNG